MGPLPLWAHFSLILAAALLLTLGAKMVVDSAVALAKRLGISELVVGLTVVAAGTSAPEFGVTLVKNEGAVSLDEARIQFGGNKRLAGGQVIKKIEIGDSAAKPVVSQCGCQSIKRSRA